MIDWLPRFWYQIRWWRWFLSAKAWPMWMYNGPYKLDKTSRRIILDRRDEEWYAREPQFRGTYPNRRTP